MVAIVAFPEGYAAADSSQSDTAVYYTAQPGTTDPDSVVECRLQWVGTQDSAILASPALLIGRWVGNDNYYSLAIYPDGNVVLSKKVAGIISLLDVATGVNLAEEMLVRFFLFDEIKCAYIDGQRVVSSNDNALTAAGEGGLGLGALIDVADDISEDWLFRGFRVYERGEADVALTFSNVVDETLSLVEAIVRSRTLVRIGDDLLPFDEALVRASVRVRFRSEQVEFSETKFFPLAKTRALDEVLQFTEATGIARTLAQILDEVSNIAEVIVTALGRVRVQNEVLQLAETAARYLAQNRVISELINLTETIRHPRVMVRHVEDELLYMTVSNIAVIITEVLTKVINETLNLSEEIVDVLGLVKVIDETLNLIEAIVRTLALVKQKTEVLSLSEILVRARALIRLKSETVNLVESFVRARNRIRRKSEQLYLFEGVPVVELLRDVLVRVVDEAFELTELLATAKTLFQVIDEAVSFAETIVKSAALNRLVSEILQIEENINPARVYLRMVNETIAFAETIVRARVLIQISNEAWSIVETVLGFLQQPEDLKFILGGINIQPLLGGIVAVLDYLAGSPQFDKSEDF